MTTSLITFAVSGVAIILLVGLKMLQQRLGFLLFWPNVREKGEKFVAGHYASIQSHARSFNKRNFYIVLHIILTRIRDFFVYLQRTIDKRLIHLVNLIKGKRVIETRVSTSHFLRDINSFKDKFRPQ